MDITTEVREARKEHDAFAVALLSSLNPRVADVSSFDTGELDFGIDADTITVGLDTDKVVQSAVGEMLVWGSIVSRHDSDKSNRRMLAEGNFHNGVRDLTTLRAC